MQQQHKLERQEFYKKKLIHGESIKRVCSLYVGQWNQLI